MAHEIMMLPIEALEHHPDNPRKELGDLKELTASIRESGVMQNLTVVPNPADEETWLVVIGNRRLEASRAAGLKELPCIISISWDEHVGEYLVCYRVRRWLDE